MQITLVQTQIEEAIRQFVGSRLNLQIGETLDLDLRATRGDDGYTCVVTVNTIANIPYTNTRPLSITQNVENARTDEEANAGLVQESEPQSGDEPEPEAILQTEAQVVEPTTKKKSIFAGLEKPTNSSNADNEAA